MALSSPGVRGDLTSGRAFTPHTGVITPNPVVLCAVHLRTGKHVLACKRVLGDIDRIRRSLHCLSEPAATGARTGRSPRADAGPASFPGGCPIRFQFSSHKHHVEWRMRLAYKRESISWHTKHDMFGRADEVFQFSSEYVFHFSFVILVRAGNRMSWKDFE